MLDASYSINSVLLVRQHKSTVFYVIIRARCFVEVKCRARYKNRRKSSPWSFILWGEITLIQVMWYVSNRQWVGRYQVNSSDCKLVTFKKMWGPQKPWFVSWRFHRMGVGPHRGRHLLTGVTAWESSCSWGRTGMWKPAEQIQNIKLVKGWKDSLWFSFTFFLSELQAVSLWPWWLKFWGSKFWMFFLLFGCWFDKFLKRYFLFVCLFLVEASHTAVWMLRQKTNHSRKITFGIFALSGK